MGLWDGALHFVVPAVIGNVIGGTVLFTVLTWGQIRAELPRQGRERRQDGEQRQGGERRR